MHGETNAQSTGIHAALLAPQSVTMWRHQDGTSHHRRQDGMALQLPAFDPSTTAVLFPESSTTPVVGHWGHLVVPQAEGDAAGDELQEGTDHSDGQACCGGIPLDESHAIDFPSERRAIEQMLQDSRESSKWCATGDDRCVFPYKAVVVLEGNWAKARGLLRHPCIAPLPRIQLPTNVRTLFWRRGEGSYRAAVDEGVCTIEAVHLLCKQLQPDGQWDDLLWLFAFMRQLVVEKSSPRMLQLMQQHEARAADGCGAIV
jgi:hypothetical protein